MTEDPFFWDRARPTRRTRPTRRASAGVPETARAGPPAPEPAVRTEEIGRLTLREAAEQYGVSASTLGAWSRAGTVDAVKVARPGGTRWMVDPASVERRLAARAASSASGPAPRRPGGGMLVPRDAWDRLLDQLTHLHEAGQQLAEARERAARAETEAVFLRERLAEMRAERDGLRSRAGAAPPPSPPDRPGLLRRIFGSSGTPGNG